MRVRMAVIILLIVLLSACAAPERAGEPSVEPIPATATPTQTATSAVTPTATPTPAPTAASTPTPSPTPTLASTPTVEPSPEQTAVETVELARDGDVVYYYVIDSDDNCVLYIDDGTPRQLDVFPKPYETGWDIDRVQQFEFCGDWIIMSVGHYEGSGNYFYGYYVRMQKDGSDLLHFRFTKSDRFIVVDDWIYVDYWEIEDDGSKRFGLYRMRPEDADTYWFDVENKAEFVDFISNIHLYEDGFIYGEIDNKATVNGWNYVRDLVRCRPDGSEMTTYFHGSELPINEESDFTDYAIDIITEDKIVFIAAVHGYNSNDSWRGHYQYQGRYSCNLDGSDLTLLDELIEAPLGEWLPDWDGEK